MEDDFDTPAAYAVLYELRDEVRKTGSGKLSGLLKALGGTIGLLLADPQSFVQGHTASGNLVGQGSTVTGTAAVVHRLYPANHSAKSEVEVEAMIADRNAAKKAKDFARADAVRKQLEEMGIVLEDKPGGMTEWRRK